MVKDKNNKNKPSFKDAFNKGRQKYTPHTKDGNTYGQAVTSNLKQNWAVVPSILALITAGMVAMTMQSHVQVRTKQIEQIESKIKGLQNTLDSARNSGKEEVVKKTVDVKMNNATDAGNRLIKYETDLMRLLDVTVSGETLTKEQISEGRKIREKIQYMTGLNESEATVTWIKVPSWTMEFKSVVSYEGNEIPSLFMLKDENGVLMGLVTAVYHADTDSFSNISITYTTEGDAVNYNRGGR